MPRKDCGRAFLYYLVYLDGQKVAEMQYRQHILTRATPGQHTLQVMRITGQLNFGPGCEAAPLELTVAANQPPHLRLCHQTIRPKSWWTGTVVYRQSLEVVGPVAVQAELPQ